MAHTPKLTKPDQSGLASFVVVGVLVVLIGLISVGFSRLVNRDLGQTVNDQKTQAAYYAAESGINDVITKLKANQAATTNSSYSSPSNCNNQLKTDVNTHAAAGTSYSCVLLNPTPTQLSRSPISPMQSWVVKVNPSQQLGNMFFTWTLASPSTPAYFASGQSLLDETTYNANRYAPMLRVTIYSFTLASNGCSTPQTQLTACAGYSSKTFFLYPTQGASATSFSYASTDGSIQNVNCGGAAPAGYTMPSSGYCGASITSLPNSPSYYYVRVTPLYAPATAYIEGQDLSNNVVTFGSGQAVVDVTAKSNNVVKRLQAYVDLSSAGGSIVQTDTIPEYALSSATTLCKRFVVPAAGAPTINTSGANDCTAGGGSGGPPPPPQPGTLPVVTTQAANLLVPYNGVKLNALVQPNDTTATYFFQYTVGNCSPSPACYSKIPSSPASLTINQGTSFSYPITKTIGSASLTCGLTYKYRGVATNPSGTAYGAWVNFTTPACGGGSSSSSSGGGITCSGVTVSKTSEDPDRESFTATGNCTGAASVGWAWQTAYSTSSCDSFGTGTGSSVTRYAQGGNMIFTITGYDSGGKAGGSASAGRAIDTGPWLCPV